ncbi:protein of unknown function [Ruminococcaceae bacterium BL-4]|nr:protein of unknown function [Ruminococcaceae bacterium BL-4]
MIEVGGREKTFYYMDESVNVIETTNPIKINL